MIDSRIFLKKRVSRSLLLLAVALHLHSAVGATFDSDSPVQSLTTERGAYRVTIRPELEPVPVGSTHRWILHVETKDGSAFLPSQLVFRAGMPSHGHGTPSQPVITRFLGDGEFLVEGVRFNMTGLWHIVVNVTGPSGSDTVLFEMDLRNPAPALKKVPSGWSRDELRVLNSLRLESLPAVPKDPSNRLSGDADAIRLGEALFIDRGLSATGKVSCADCHDPSKFFTDGRVVSFGSQPTARHSPTLIGVGHGHWFYWDGRRDSLWSQAVTPIETSGEMDANRMDAVRYVISHNEYRSIFLRLSSSLTDIDLADESRFPPGAGPYAGKLGKHNWHRMSKDDRHAVNQAFSDIGKVLAAYVETIQPKKSRFDQFVAELLQGNRRAANNIMSKEERQGLKLFIDESRVPCIRCHNGPLFTNNEFHNIATGTAADGTFDFGRFIGLQAALVDEFNCRGAYSDAMRESCDRLKYATEGHLDHGAFKVPTLRNSGVTPPYMHDGRFRSLIEVIEHYQRVGEIQNGTSEVPKFQISKREAGQIAGFLRSLTSIPSVRSE